MVIQINLDDLDDDVRELVLASGKLCTREQAIRKAVLDAFDPMIAGGLPFEFEPRPDDEMYLSLLVPGPDAITDLAICWKIAQLDAKACALILERDHSLAATVRVYSNTLSWLRFWECRHPNDTLRAQFSAQLSVRRAMLERLKHRAKYEFKFEIAEALADVG